MLKLGALWYFEMIVFEKRDYSYIESRKGYNHILQSLLYYSVICFETHNVHVWQFPLYSYSTLYMYLHFEMAPETNLVDFLETSQIYVY